MSDEAKETELDEVVEFVEQEKRFKASLDKYHHAMSVEYDYAYKLKQHSDTQVRELERKNRLKVVSLDLYDINRYTAATVAGTAIYLDVRPIGPGMSDEESKMLEEYATITRAVMEAEVHDIDKGYPRVRRRVVRLAGGARAGAARLDIVETGPYGVEVIPKVVDPQNITWDGTQFMHPMDPECDQLWETITADLEWAKAKWKDKADLLHADDGEQVLIVRGADPDVDRSQQHETEHGRITLKVGWIKNDPTEVEVKKHKPLAPEKQYLACAKCGYTEQDLVETPGYDGLQQPDEMACPQCGFTPEGQPASMLHKVDNETEIGWTRAYTDGNRRVVLAPFCPAAGLLEDGPWPKGLTNFPYMLHVSDPFPLEPYGNSATFLNMDLQALKNASLRSGFEQMDRNRDLILAKEDSIWDAQHEPYQFDGSGDPVAYVTTYDDLQGIKQFQGAGLNSAFGQWMATIDNELGRHRGVGQIAADAGQIKGMPVGTVARIQETGDVPLDEVIRILREDEEQFLNRWAEMISGCWTEGRWQEVTGKDGATMFRLFRPEMAKRMRIRVHASPNLDMVDKAKIEAAKALIGAPPSIIRLAAKGANLPKEIIDELIQASTPPAGAPLPGQSGEMPMGPSPEMSGLAPGPAGAPPLELMPAGMQ